MIKKMKQFLTALLLAGALAIPVAVPVTVSAQEDPIQDGLCTGSNLSFTETGCAETEGSGERLNELVTDIINIVSIVVAIVAVIMIIFGGLKYITSGGESSNVSSAKNTIIYAIIGLVVVALAQFVVRFVLGQSIETAGILPLLVNLL